ncbi:DUF6381 family protein [Streptomyces sp. HPF1205]|uniref:DUF6381 family protein n=1 Tax=Streptomyces sp. HPF1205 TaxID=2873262 RepID=UPI001CECDAB8|nr:DUF6381 family protein [Streptomyces sp. HPF1205]
MSGTQDPHEDIRRMREEARRLDAEARRTDDPAERDRLRERIRRLEFEIAQESMMAAGDIYPVE